MRDHLLTVVSDADVAYKLLPGKAGRRLPSQDATRGALYRSYG
jgi:hypothetical protein